MTLAVKIALGVAAILALLYGWLASACFRHPQSGGTEVGIVLLLVGALPAAFAYLAYLASSHERGILALVLLVVSYLIDGLLLIAVPAITFGIANP